MLYWGTYLNGTQYGYSNPPWDMRALDEFEARVGKKISVLHFGQPWSRAGTPQPFYPSPLQACRDRGIIPLVDWASWDLPLMTGTTESAMSLSTIINGDHDAYITSWATGAKNWGHPFFLRFDHEMNGNWYPWSEVKNGNQPGQYAQAWRHVWGIFNSLGVTNVSWVWCPNIIYPGSLDLASLYPGSLYVDWVGIDGYNSGINAAKPDSTWKTFSQVIDTTYNSLVAIAPTKPFMIGEFASSEVGGSKAAWIHDAFMTMPLKYPKINCALWFNWNTDSEDWVVETSYSALAAFRGGIAGNRYLAGPVLVDGKIPLPDTLSAVKY